MGIGTGFSTVGTDPLGLVDEAFGSTTVHLINSAPTNPSYSQIISNDGFQFFNPSGATITWEINGSGAGQPPPFFSSHFLVVVRDDFLTFSSKIGPGSSTVPGVYVQLSFLGDGFIGNIWIGDGAAIVQYGGWVWDGIWDGFRSLHVELFLNDSGYTVTATGNLGGQ